VKKCLKLNAGNDKDVSRTSLIAGLQLRFLCELLSLLISCTCVAWQDQGNNLVWMQENCHRGCSYPDKIVPSCVMGNETSLASCSWMGRFCEISRHCTSQEII